MTTRMTVKIEPDLKREIKGIEGGFYPNFCSDAKNAPKGTKEFYPTSPIETKFRPSKNRQTGNWDLQTAPITSKCWRSP